MYYTKTPKKPNISIVENVLGCNFVMSFQREKETFQQVLTDVVADELSYTVITQVCLAVYIDGVFKAKWCFEDCEIRRRFCNQCKKAVIKKSEFINKFGKREYNRVVKENPEYFFAVYYTPYFGSFRTLKSHFIKNNQSKELGERAKEIRAGHVDPTEDNMCKLTVDGRKIGLDQRCMSPNLPDDPKSKVNVCINNVFDIWQKTAAEKSTQLIFCDLATPQPTLNENTYTVFRKNEKGGYSDVYSAKLGERDTAEKIMKKLNGKKPPKNYEAGDVSDGDIIMLKRVNYEEETAYNTAFEVVDGKLTEITPETWEKLNHTPVEDFESERRFCVYDDIKQKLIEKGVPEKEIAFIHDVDKAEEKQKLYDKMNKGEIRVLIGSTFKCGAGMNAQERMIALHDLDAPMRPSDVEPTSRCIIKIA